jgi:hypothetical protein
MWNNISQLKSTLVHTEREIYINNQLAYFMRGTPVGPYLTISFLH